MHSAVKFLKLKIIGFAEFLNLEHLSDCYSAT